ncbi:MAG: phospholipid carrier-dependent glycosyltransferase [Desulfurococcus sp.]|jgi:predicted membrane-bound dolichyl-phosphate-mannose-protein mannosyltransferase|uniref:phospholipid carrier-dependent glycosyltransferase n=1 Tax=Desulfurococcus sp. TaxID=51678 RepID=UPI0031633AB4
MILLCFVAYRLVYIDLHLSLSPGSYRESYVSDEVWYVTSARNILVKLFGVNVLNTWLGDGLRCTLILSGRPNETLVNELCSTDSCRILDSGYTGVEYTYATVTWDGGSTAMIPVPLGSGLNAVYVELYDGLEPVAEKAGSMGYNITGYICGWALPDKNGLNDYMNLEHPPLGKYIIGLSLLLGDNPFTWRLPSIISTTLLFLLGYAVTLYILRGITSEPLARLIALATPLLMLTDNSYFTVGALAMLDSFLALFTLLGLYMLVEHGYASLGSRVARVLVFSLAGCVKASGLFAVPGDFIEGLLDKRGALTRVRNGFSQLLLYFTIYPLILLVLSHPFINAMGWSAWFKTSVEGSIKWHTGVKTTSDTIASSPLDWLLGSNSFYMWLDASTGEWVRCSGQPIIYLTALVAGLVFSPWIIKRDELRRVWLLYLSILSGYVILYLIGNKSLYSFYIIHFAPVSTVLLVSITVYMFKTAYSWWRKRRDEG